MKMREFIHLRTHSYYSFLKALPSVEALCETAQSCKMKGLALTDIGGIYGVTRFWKAAKETGLAPIIGVELEVPSNLNAPPRPSKSKGSPPNPSNWIVLLVETTQGFSSLCRLITAYHTDASLSLVNLISLHHQGIICITPNGDLLKTLHNRLKQGCLYIGLEMGLPTIDLLHLSRQLERPYVAVGNVRWVDLDDIPYYQVLRAIGQNTSLANIKEDFGRYRFWTPAEAISFFSAFPEAIQNTTAIFERCRMPVPPYGSLVPPQWHSTRPKPNLRDLCYQAIHQRYPALTQTIRNRLDYELGIIEQKGYGDYFLIVHDIVRRFSLTCGRGSGASSLVSYLLMITDVDPLAHNLYFERFLNPERDDPPDIDVDFAWDEREAVLDYIFKTYGKAYAAMVSNHVTLGVRAALRETAKVFGRPDAEISQITRHLS